MNINDELTRKLSEVAQGIMLPEDNTNSKSDDGEGMDKVQPKAVKKKFDDRKDKDIDNDGDVDSSDEYIHAKRKAISKAIKKEETELEEATELYKKGKISLTKFAMGKGKGAGLQINYGMKFIQIPEKDIKQLQDALVYVTKSVPQFKESTDLEEGDMSRSERLKGIAARKKELEATISRLRATHSKDTGDDRVSTMRAIDMNKELLKKVIANEKKVMRLKESTDLEEATDFEKTNTLTSDEYDEVQNFQNFNKKDWRWLPKQGIYTRKKKV
jgi:hypothetical protein